MAIQLMEINYEKADKVEMQLNANIEKGLHKMQVNYLRQN